MNSFAKDLNQNLDTSFGISKHRRISDEISLDIPAEGLVMEEESYCLANLRQNKGKTKDVQ